MLSPGALLLAAAAALLAGAAADVVYYDSYNGSVLTDDQLSLREAENNTYYCVNTVPTCNSSEGRRIDGSCNSLQYPQYGTGHAPFTRVLPANYSTGSEPRLAANGSALPNARWLRTRAVAEGRVEGNTFSTLVLFYLAFSFADIASMNIFEMLNYLEVHPHCCDADGADDSVCYPMSMPWDDPVHRFSGERCLNMTRPITFQNYGCIPNTTQPIERLNWGTPVFDLSNVYGNLNETSTRQRLYTGGLLNYTTTPAGEIWPQFILPAVNKQDGIQALTGVNFPGGLWHWREHNRIAAQLAAINPAWDDELLFETARDINIAVYSQIVYYEMFVALMGQSNLENASVIGTDSGFRDVYNASLAPTQLLEPLIALRWIHTVQPGSMHLYTSEGAREGPYALTDMQLTYATAYPDNYLEGFTNGACRSRAAAADNIVDPDMAEWAFGRYQRTSDVFTSDLTRGRLLGAQPYVRYAELVAGADSGSFDSWDSLEDFISEENRYLLSQLYNVPSDVDLMVGLWLERAESGAALPRTMQHLMLLQLQLAVQSDRHWFEREARPNAFTEDQLLSIRNASMARLLCDNGDNVTSIQLKPFEQVSSSNPLTACSEIPAVDLTLWLDSNSDSESDSDTAASRRRRDSPRVARVPRPFGNTRHPVT